LQQDQEQEQDPPTWFRGLSRKIVLTTMSIIVLTTMSILLVVVAAGVTFGIVLAKQQDGPPVGPTLPPCSVGGGGSAPTLKPDTPPNGGDGDTLKSGLKMPAAPTPTGNEDMLEPGFQPTFAPTNFESAVPKTNLQHLESLRSRSPIPGRPVP
jgi:hypothetical protein